MSNDVPKHLKFTPTHEWIHEESNQVTLGITEHAQSALGDLVFVDLPEIGATFQANDELGVVESVKAASDIYAPISGTVIAVNQTVSDNPGLVNSDPYGDGWLVKLTPTHPEEISALLDAEQYHRTLSEE